MSQLADIAAEFEAISERARLVVGRLKPSAVALRPGPNQWSVAECLRHLTITADAYVLVWQEAIDDARAAGLVGREPFKLDLWGRAFCWFLEPLQSCVSWRRKPFTPWPHLMANEPFRLSSRASSVC